MQAGCTHDGNIWFIFLLAVITNTVHLTWGFLCMNLFADIFPCRNFFGFSATNQYFIFLSFTPPMLSFLAVTVSVIKSSCFMLREVHRRIRDPFSLETKKSEINICLSVCCYGNFVLGTCRQWWRKIKWYHQQLEELSLRQDKPFMSGIFTPGQTENARDFENKGNRIT